MEDEFKAGVAASHELFARAKGCHGASLQQSVEEPAHFVLLVKWDSVADHNEGFRASPDFQIWRKNVGHCFAAPPRVWHGQAV
jgi:quinol monooxygenase YgiN